MKSLVSTVALSAVFVLMCVGTLTGIGFGALVVRGIVVFFAVYACMLAASLLVCVSSLPRRAAKVDAADLPVAEES